MIQTKADLVYYMQCDKIALRQKRNKPRPFMDETWRYEIVLRKLEYWTNNKSKPIGKLMRIYYALRHKLLSNKMTVFIPPNVFGPGLSIAHGAVIYVHEHAKIGSNCRIHECVNIGSTNGSDESAHIGDNCFIGSGAKIIGELEIGNDVAIGAGAVVVRSFPEDHVTLAGVPAKIISHNGSAANLVKATELVEHQ